MVCFDVRWLLTKPYTPCDVLNFYRANVVVLFGYHLRKAFENYVLIPWCRNCSVIYAGKIYWSQAAQASSICRNTTVFVQIHDTLDILCKDFFFNSFVCVAMLLWFWSERF